MTALARLQQIFQQCVLQPHKPITNSWVSASGRSSPATQLAVYKHAYRARLSEVLANDYPATHMAIGDESFYRLANDYIRAHPSCYFSLRLFGRHLRAFIAKQQQSGDTYKDMPWLEELIHFEWTLGQTFDAADADLFREQDMAGFPLEAWPELRFKVHHSVHRLDLQWNTPMMWKALTTDDPVPVTAVHDNASPWLIWRQQLVTRFRSMSDDEQQALDLVCGGGSFHDVCERLATMMNEEEVPQRAAVLLKGWFVQGLISGVR